MHFSKLRLAGFKSFVEATEFEILPGLTGIVGPNGCGKSNLVEALRWVMGENSYKSMRASGMDDVIFAGGGSRPARNMAEVGLTLDNAARTAPAAFNDAEVLEVTRRIEREQGSTYRINGREVRARDVQILFADASTGSRSPALVRQGQISEIIAAKPQSRRRILEEAAGVAGLHTRRHEAELRLKGAEDNLARIDDVLTQIASQGDGLRRQARQAGRYRELQAQIRRTQALQVLIEWEEAEREQRAAAVDLTAANAAVVEATRAQGEAARHQAVAAHSLPALRKAETEAGAVLQRTVVARETLDGEERRAKGRLAEVERRLKEMEADLARDAAALDDAGISLARLAAEAAELGEAASGAGTEALEVSLQAKAAAAEAARLAAERRFGEAQAARAEADARRRSLDERLREESTRLARFERDLAEAGRRRAALAADLDGGEGLADAAAKLTSAAEAAADAEAAARDAERASTQARDAESRGRGPLVEADRKAQRLDTEVRTLSKLLETGSGKWRPITDAMVVAKGYEAALGAALGDDLDASDDPRAPAHWAEVVPVGGAALPSGATPLLDHVEAPPALRQRLAQIGLVARADGAVSRERLAPGQRLVSREGDIWRWDGFTQAAEAPTPAARRLVERNRLADLRGEEANAREGYLSLKANADGVAAALREAVAREAAARASAQSMRRTAEKAREAYGSLERLASEARARLATLEASETATRGARDEAAGRRAEADAAVAALPPTQDLADTMERAGSEASTQRTAETEARATLQALGREREARARRLAAVATERQSWEARAAQASAHRAQLETRLVAARDERKVLLEAPDRFALAKRQVRADVESAETASRAAGDARVSAETALAAADREARVTLEAMAAARERKARCEARAEATAQRVEAVGRISVTELDCAPAGLPALAGVAPQGERASAAHVAMRLDALRADRDRLGAVNLRADEELAAIEAQSEGLAKEKADLAEAIRRLRQAIASLNKEGRERLLGAFDTVNGHFKDLFTGLFGGGEAELQLVESEDPLEAGLEILARPPGKKPQVMSLLSGGEQALTAISLIFAVFLTNPSPICVLDEVDAPLDDANVERFCDLVDTMRGKTDTRFLTITHNPITMARMDRLYGVTQAERGISTLVSVDLAGAEELLEAS